MCVTGVSPALTAGRFERPFAGHWRIPRSLPAPSNKSPPTHGETTHTTTNNGRGPPQVNGLGAVYDLRQRRMEAPGIAPGSRPFAIAIYRRSKLLRSRCLAPPGTAPGTRSRRCLMRRFGPLSHRWPPSSSPTLHKQRRRYMGSSSSLRRASTPSGFPHDHARPCL